MGAFDAQLQQRGLVVPPDGADSLVTAGEVAQTAAGLETADICIQVLRARREPLNEVLENTIALWREIGYGYQLVLDRFGGWIDIARNWQLALFLRARNYKGEPFRYLMLVDADVAALPDHPYQLARHGLPVVSGCVAAHTAERGTFICVAVKGPDGKARFPTAKHTKVLPGKGICEVHNCGAGLLMIRRDVIETLMAKHDEDVRQRAIAVEVDTMLLGANGDPLTLTQEQRAAVQARIRRSLYEHDLSGAPFSIPESVREKSWRVGNILRGEDMCFTDRVRAAGYTMHVDFEVHAVHEKTLGLEWSKKNIDPELSVEDWRISAFDYPVEDMR